jgi:hypothetical protein
VVRIAEGASARRRFEIALQLACRDATACDVGLHRRAPERRATAFPVCNGADAALRDVFDSSRPALGGEERNCAFDAINGVIAKLRPFSFILA